MQSMTGYGRSEGRNERFHFTVEARSVNHRYLDVSLRYPSYYAPLEGRMKQLVSDRFARGRIDVKVAQRQGEGEARALAVDMELARQYYQVLQQLQAALHLSGSIDLGMFVGLRDILQVESVPQDMEAAWAALAPGLNAALQEVEEMRRQEGAFLGRDLRERLRVISAHIDGIRQRLPLVVTEYRQRLEERVKDLFQQFALDPERLSQEAILFAERTDITEELTRFEAHVQAFGRFLSATEPVGRKLEFLVQEIHREVNTIGAKSNDTSIAHAVVEIKSELERMREQIQNIA